MCDVPLQFVVNTFFNGIYQLVTYSNWKISSARPLTPRIVKACTVNRFGGDRFSILFLYPYCDNIYSRFKHTSSSPTVRFCCMPGLRSEHVLITSRTNSMNSTHQSQTQTWHCHQNSLSMSFMLSRITNRFNQPHRLSLDHSIQNNPCFQRERTIRCLWLVLRF
jgi:hypothetical protein